MLDRQCPLREENCLTGLGKQIWKRSVYLGGTGETNNFVKRKKSGVPEEKKLISTGPGNRVSKSAL